MKQTIAISLTVLYLLFNIGVVLNFHLCDRTIDGISLVNKPQNCCPNPASCCHDAAFRLSIKADYTGADLVDFKVARTFEYACIDEEQATFSYHALKLDASVVHDAPLVWLKTPIYLSNRILLI